MGPQSVSLMHRYDALLLSYTFMHASFDARSTAHAHSLPLESQCHRNPLFTATAAGASACCNEDRVRGAHVCTLGLVRSNGAGARTAPRNMHGLHAEPSRVSCGVLAAGVAHGAPAAVGVEGGALVLRRGCARPLVAVVGELLF
jgi:hypothetical protein